MIKKFLFVIGLLLVACQPEIIEVTRIVEKEVVAQVTQVVEIRETVVVTATPTTEPTPTETFAPSQTPWVVTATPTDTPEPTETPVPTETPETTVTEALVSTQIDEPSFALNWGFGFESDRTRVTWIGLSEGDLEVHYWLWNAAGRCGGSASDYHTGFGEIFLDSSCADAQLTVQVREPLGGSFNLLFEETRNVEDDPPTINGGGDSQSPLATRTPDSGVSPTKEPPPTPRA